LTTHTEITAKNHYWNDKENLRIIRKWAKEYADEVATINAEQEEKERQENEARLEKERGFEKEKVGK
jgi:hypothetical protein